MREIPERTALYRIRGEGDALLYIGITCNLAMRWNGHQRKQPWWDELRSLTVDWYDSRDEAEAAEEAAIKAERPKYNKTYLVKRPRRLTQVVAVDYAPPDYTGLDRRAAGDGLLTLAGLADFLDISPKLLDRLTRTGAGPASVCGMGAERKYLPADVRDWLKTRRKEVSSDSRGAA